jgi:hypothetical protein
VIPPLLLILLVVAVVVPAPTEEVSVAAVVAALLLPVVIYAVDDVIGKAAMLAINKIAASATAVIEFVNMSRFPDNRCK